MFVVVDNMVKIETLQTIPFEMKGVVCGLLYFELNICFFEIFLRIWLPLVSFLGLSLIFVFWLSIPLFMVFSCFVLLLQNCGIAKIFKAKYVDIFII